MLSVRIHAAIAGVQNMLIDCLLTFCLALCERCQRVVRSVVSLKKSAKTNSDLN